MDVVPTLYHGAGYVYFLAQPEVRISAEELHTRLGRWAREASHAQVRRAAAQEVDLCWQIADDPELLALWLVGAALASRSSPGSFDEEIAALRAVRGSDVRASAQALLRPSASMHDLDSRGTDGRMTS